MARFATRRRFNSDRHKACPYVMVLCEMEDFVQDDNRSQPKRKPTIRWEGHDYSEPGAYFVTLCTQDRRQFFGNVTECVMNLNPIGNMMTEMWTRIPERFHGVELDEMMLMPDHLHGIILIGTDPNVTTLPRLGDIIRYFKGTSTHRYIKEHQQNGWPRFNQRIWQQRYYDRVVRSDKELDAIRGYIITNPERWGEPKS